MLAPVACPSNLGPINLLLLLQETFTVRVQSATALTTSNLKASNGDIVSVSATPGTANSYDVAAKSRTNKGIMTLSTVAGAGVLANTITVNVDVTNAQVSWVALPCPCLHNIGVCDILHFTASPCRQSACNYDAAG